QFRTAMLDAGLAPPEAIEADGQLHRYHVEGDKAGSKNAYYVLHLDGRAAGVFSGHPHALSVPAETASGRCRAIAGTHHRPPERTDQAGIGRI
ncbi:hypothetical protein, partial [Escherichia coli]|uniref:hypothetical protein n=1 Tax=Escherichia coli TaxID=562 RepID=UPI003F44C88C